MHNIASVHARTGAKKIIFMNLLHFYLMLSAFMIRISIMILLYNTKIKQNKAKNKYIKNKRHSPTTAKIFWQSRVTFWYPSVFTPKETTYILVVKREVCIFFYLFIFILCFLHCIHIFTLRRCNQDPAALSNFF